MSVRSARVRDFQSVQDSAVEFGNFTVLVGPSNSGKSGFLRGIRACLRNTAVPANVRQGTTKAVIAVEFDNGTVEIERGKSLSTYKLHRDTSETFTKSSRVVPDSIAKLIRFPLIEGTDPTFAFQFDKPFLLSETGSQAGQVIGSLTNVSMLHTAVREANRRRQESAGVLRTRQGDIARYTAQLSEYAPLRARRAALDRADQLMTEAKEIEQELGALSRSARTATITQADLDTLIATEPPDVLGRLVEVEDLNRRRIQLRAATDQIRNLAAILHRLAGDARTFRDNATRLTTEREQLLRDLGTCPTCGAITS